MDKKRSQLRAEFAGKKMDLVNYDLIFSCQTLESDEIVKLVVKAAKIKGLV